MRIEIARNQLAGLLSQVTKAVEARNTIPILNHVRLEVSNGRLFATASDLDIEIKGSIKVECSEDWSGCLQASLLTKIIGKLKGDTVTLEPGDDQAVVKSGRSQFKLNTLPAADFPTMAMSAMEATYEIDLAEIVAPTVFAISSEETRYYLNGVFLESGAATATDGHRLAHVERKPWGEHPGIIIPRKMVGLIPKGVQAVSIGQSRIQIETDDITINSKLIDGNFPDYRRVIPSDNDKLAAVDRDALRAAADRVVLVSDQRAVKLAFAGDNIDLFAKGQSGNAEDSVACTYSDEPMDIGFNSKYLADLLANLPTGEIKIALKDPGSPALITSVEDDTVKFVLMPMRFG